jgi:hypothetical protein
MDVSRFHADLGSVDALARLKLEARRRGCALRFENPSSDLRALLGLCGLGEALLVEPRRDPEELEQPLGVEEERQLGDPTA